MTKYWTIRLAIDFLIKHNSFGHTYCKSDYDEIETLYNSICDPTPQKIIDEYIKNHCSKVEAAESTESVEHTEPVTAEPANKINTNRKKKKS